MGWMENLERWWQTTLSQRFIREMLAPLRNRKRRGGFRQNGNRGRVDGCIEREDKKGERLVGGLGGGKELAQEKRKDN